MIRKRIFITAAFLCHLLIVPGIVTAQLRCPPPSAAALRGEVADVCAIEQEKEGSIYKLHHRGKIAFRSYILWADEATYDSDSGEVEAEGHVLLEGGLNDEYINASRATYNVQTDTGHFYHVIGTIGAKRQGGAHFLTTTNPFAFTGKVVDKTGPQQYVVHHGTVTSCEVPHPKWQFNSPHSVINVDGNAHIYLTTFRVRGIPVFFLPFATHPVQRQARQSGFLMPTFGTSNVKGTILGDSFYWAINRSMDATVGAELFTSRGWAQRAEFRAVPNAKSYLGLNYFGVEDRGNPKTKQDQGGREVRFSGTDNIAGFRGVASIDYLSSFQFRVVWGQIFSAVYSEVISQGFLSKSSRGYSYNLWLQHYQNFLSPTVQNEVITIDHLPSLEFSSVDRELGHSGLYWNLEAAAEGLNRSQPPLTTGQVRFSTARLVGRFDATPNVSLPLRFHGWSLRPEIGVRDTLYTQQLTPGQRFACSPLCQFGGNPVPSPVVAIDDPINRDVIEGSAELRPPVLEKTFKGTLFGSKIKHAIEPRVVYRRVAGVDDFQRIPRFDWRDVLSSTHEVQYGFVNRLFAKKMNTGDGKCTAATPTPVIPQGVMTIQGQVSPDSELPERKPADEKASPQGSEAGKEAAVPCPPAVARELISWELAQKYFIDPTFGGALVPEHPNVFATTVDFDAITFLTAPRHLSPLISRLRVQPGGTVDAEWDADYDFSTRRINYSALTLGYRVGQLGFGGGDTYMVVPGVLNINKPDIFHQARALVTYGSPVKRGLSGASSMGFDIHSGFLQYLAVQSTYNWDCCGFTIDFRRFVLGAVRNENQYRFTFNVANIGSFGNLTRRYRMY